SSATLATAGPGTQKQLWPPSLTVLANPAPPAHGSPAWVQAPPLQTSAPLQKRPSSHGAVLFGCVHVPVPLHRSSVHGLPSLVQAVPDASHEVWPGSVHG